MDLSSLHPALSATNLEKSLESFSDESKWEKLGEGGFSTVYRAKFKEQHIEVALKKLKTPVDLREVAVLLKAITSDYIVNIKAVIRADSMSTMCSHIAMELLPCDFQMLRNNIKISQAKWSSIWPSITSINLDVCKGFSYLHSCDIIHCDIKPSNILISHSLQAKVTDCGLARLTGVDSGTSSQGTVDQLLVMAPSGSLPYISPQLLEDPHKAVTEDDDLYSFGLLVYKGITNVNLFEMELEENEVMTDARINDFKLWVLKNKDRPDVDLLPKFCTPEKMKKMITSCWNHELSSRNSFEHWVGTLEDQYNTYTKEEKYRAKKALETAVTAVISDGNLPQIPSQSININDISFLNQLGQKLDPPSFDGNDWHKLADELGFKVRDIDLIENRESNPTTAVLEAASHKGVDVSPERLIEIAKKMKRTDVVNVIQNLLQPTETERLDVTDSSTLTVFEIHELKVFEVLRVLDVASELGNDWKALAGKLDFTPDKINKIQQSCYQKHKSPTDVVLKAACQQAKLKSYQHLIELLTKILRPDVATKLKQVL